MDVVVIRIDFVQVFVRAFVSYTIPSFVISFLSFYLQAVNIKKILFNVKKLKVLYVCATFTATILGHTMSCIRMKSSF